MRDESAQLLKTVLALPPRAQEAWLGRHTVGAPVGKSPFNWILFAEVIADWRAYTKSLAPTAYWEGGRLSLRSAHVSLRVFEGLASRPSEVSCLVEGGWIRHPIDPDVSTFTFSAMRLRARMINDFGAREGHAVLDAERIVKWCRKLVPVLHDETLPHLHEHSLHPSHEQRHRLGNIRKCYGVFMDMRASGVWEKHPELHGMSKVVACYWPGVRLLLETSESIG